MEKNKDPLTKEQILAIPNKIEEGKTIQQIAEEYGRHENSIKSWIRKLRKAGIKVNTQKGRRGLLESIEGKNGS